KSLSADSQWFIFLVALLPGIDCNVLQSIYQELAIRFNFHVNSVQFLVKHHYAFLSNHLRPQFSHPSYEQAIIELLREEYALQIGKIVDFSLNQVLLFDTLAIGRCDNADFSWPRTNENHQLDIRNYLNQFIETYNYLINSHFSKIYESLPPYNTHKAAALILINTENTAGQLSIVETEDASTIFMEHPDNLSLRIHELMRHRITVNLPIDFWEIKYSDLQMRSPQLHALSILRERVENAFKKNRIQESWAITYYRIESALHHLCTGLIRLEANPSVPFSTEMIEPLFQQFKTLTENRPDGWPEFGWNNMLESSSKQILGLERAVRTLEKQKKVYSGPLLTQPDLQPSGYSYMAWARYSAPQMTIAIRRFFDLVFSAYRQMVEINFPSLANKFERYKQKDIKILGALTYKSHFGSEMSRFYFLPKDFPLQDSGNFEIYVECDLDNRDPNIIPFRQEIIKRFSDAEASGPLQRMGLNPSTFISGKSLIEYVYKWVKEDLDEVMGWQAVGNQRQHHQNRNAASFELPPQHSLYWDMHQFVDPRDMSDWPSLSL
ncbi:MAG: hypothetical protein ABIY70_03385, partial [Capsulimonas sp.]|uniref:hypothetical protein n=1 Tax=Capsulimonas sp. TaxID=2494211 RepID=UPI003263C152